MIDSEDLKALNLNLPADFNTAPGKKNRQKKSKKRSGMTQTINVHMRRGSQPDNARIDAFRTLNDDSQLAQDSVDNQV